MTKRRALEIHYNMWTRVVNIMKEKKCNYITSIKILALKEMVKDKCITHSEYDFIERNSCSQCALCVYKVSDCSLCDSLGFNDNCKDRCLGGMYDKVVIYLDRSDFANALSEARKIANLYYVGKAKLEEMGEW